MYRLGVLPLLMRGYVGVADLTAENNQLIDEVLLHRIWAGEEMAKENLIRKYMPMLRKIVHTRAPWRNDLEDLCQEGAIGLLKAIREYDCSRFAIKFSTFAYICILRRISNVIKHSMTKKSRLLGNAVSLNSPSASDDSWLIGDLLKAEVPDPSEVVIQRWSEERLRYVLRAHLTSVEYAVISRFLQGLSLYEIQTELSVTPKVIDNARTRARQKLRRLVAQYGSLLSPDLPLTVKKRLDLSIEIRVS